MGYEAMREADPGPAEARWASSRRTPSCRRSTRSAPPRRAPAPTGQPFPPLDATRPWDSLSRRREAALRADGRGVRRASSPTPTHQIGRLLDYLEETGQRENTMVIVVSDNGASGEGGPDGSVNEMLFMNGIPDDIAANLAMLDELGGPKTYNHYPNGWAMAFNTPFKMWKRYEFNGGTSDPCVISWPAGIDRARARSASSTTTRSTWCPTVLDVLGVEPPDDDQGTHPEPLRRREHALQLRRRRRRPGERQTQFYSMLGSRGIWHDGWKAITTHPTISGWCALQRRRVGALPRRRRPLRAAQPRRRAPRQAPRDGQPLVRRGRRQRGLPARRPLGAGDPRRRRGRSCRRRATATSTSPTTPRCPRPRRSSSAAGPSSIGALVDLPDAGRPGRALRAGVAVRRPRPLRQGQPAALRQQLRRHVRAEGRRDRGPADRRRT